MLRRRRALRRPAERFAQVFPDFRLEVFERRHHFDPPHHIEPQRLAASLHATRRRADSDQSRDAQPLLARPPAPHSEVICGPVLLISAADLITGGRGKPEPCVEGGSGSGWGTYDPMGQVTAHGHLTPCG